METTITLRTRTLGWGYETQPTGHGTDIEIPTRPYHTGTYRQICSAIPSDRTYQSLRSGGTFINTAWFVGGQRIVAIRFADEAGNPKWYDGSTPFGADLMRDLMGGETLRRGLTVRTETRRGRRPLFHNSRQVRISATVLPEQAEWLRNHGGSATVRRLIAQAISS